MRLPLLAGLVLLAGCVFNRPDRFYLLDSGDARPLNPRSKFTTQVTLHLTLPVLVDRSELVLMNPDGVRILEHERWAAPLGDQAITVLGQDIEARREDVIMASRRTAQPGVPNATIFVEVVQLMLRQNSGARIEVRWRMEDGRGGEEQQGRETFTGPTAADGNFKAMTHSVDVCLGLLADRLVSDLPR